MPNVWDLLPEFGHFEGLRELPLNFTSHGLRVAKSVIFVSVA